MTSSGKKGGIRSKFGVPINVIIRRIESLHTKEFIPAKYKVSFPRHVQLGLFGIGNKGHVKLGSFYELMTKALFGGEMMDILFCGDYYGSKKTLSEFRPDVYNRRSKIMLESKAIRVGHQLNSYDFQLDKYLKYQILTPNLTIFWAVWRHNFPAIKSFCGADEELYDELANRTKLGIIFPLSILETIHDTINEDIGKRYDGNKWLPCTRINSGVLNLFITDLNILLDGLNLPRSRFRIERFISPKGLTIEQKEVMQFPIIVVIDNEYERWVKEKIEEYDKEIPF